jgi:hypothetical protein
MTLMLIAALVVAYDVHVQQQTRGDTRTLFQFELRVLTVNSGSPPFVLSKVGFRP